MACKSDTGMAMKINRLVKGGYKQASFRYKKNALYFGKLWKLKGYNTKYFSSSGPVVEGGYAKNAYYSMAYKPKVKSMTKALGGKTTRKRRKR